MFTSYDANLNGRLSMRYKEGTSAKTGNDWSGIFLSVKHGDVYLNPRPLFLPTGDDERAAKDEAKIFEILDHLAETFLPAASVKDLKIGNPSIKEYYHSMEAEMKELKFWQKSLYFKMVPDRDGNPAFGSLPFLSLKPNLRYTEAEQDLVKDNVAHDTKIPKYNGGAAVAADVGNEDEEDRLPF